MLHAQAQVFLHQSAKIVVVLFGQQELGKKNSLVMCSWGRAIEELMCDMFCAEIFGPAALLAMRTYASFSEWKTMPRSNNNFYPPWQYRFEIVWQNALDKGDMNKLWSGQSETKLTQAFRAELETFGGTLESREGYDFVCNDTINRIAYAEVDILISDAHDYVVSQLPGTISKWTDEKVLDQIPILVDRLEKGIPNVSLLFCSCKVE